MNRHSSSAASKALGPAYRLFYARPVEVVRGEGVWLYDAEGKPMLDVYNNVASLGHCHPHVVSAMARQAATLCTNTRYLNEDVLRLCGAAPVLLPARTQPRDVHLHRQRKQ